MATGLRLRQRHRPQLPLVPLIDVLVMLVIFAFVTMRFANTQTLNLTLPKADTAGKNQIDPRGVTIVIQRDGSVFFNGRKTTEDELSSLLSQVKNISRDIPVLVSMDENIPVKTLTFVMDACRSQGLNKISMQTQ